MNFNTFENISKISEMEHLYRSIILLNAAFNEIVY